MTPLLSYATLFVALAVIFALVIVAAAVSEFLGWRARRKAPEWVAAELRKRGIVPRMYIDAKPEPDPRSSLETFSKTIPRQHR